MDATKENCQKARSKLTYQMTDEDHDFVAAFLFAALKRLPSQVAVDKDKLRKKTATKEKQQ